MSSVHYDILALIYQYMLTHYRGYIGNYLFTILYYSGKICGTSAFK